MRAQKFPLNLLAMLIATAPMGSYADMAKKPTVDEGIDEVVVIKRRESDYSVITEQAQKILDVPGAMGDPLIAAFSLPGVLAKGEGGAPAVRGSSPYDNRYMVDGAPAGYVFHTFSTSVFNENIIQNFELYSAGFGAQYSDAIGGVFDITLRDPKHQPVTTKLDLNTLRLGAFVEGEVTENSAFYLSARGSILHLLMTDKMKEDMEKEDGIRVEEVPQDTDYQFKYVYDLNENNKFTLSANGATDKVEAAFTENATEVMEDPDMAGDARIQNKYNNASARWRFTGDNGNAFTLQAGRYINRDDTAWGGNRFFLNYKNVDDYALGHLDFLVGRNHNITLGAEVHRQEFSYDGRFVNYVCTETDPDCAYRRGDLINAEDKFDFSEHTLYANDHWLLGDSVALDVGVQSHRTEFTDETFTHPRVAASWKLNEHWTLTSSAGSYDRFPDYGKVFPDIGNPDLKSPTSDHYTLGIKQTFGDGWSWSATTYYKTMDQLPLSMPAGQEPFYTNNMEGEAYGLEVFINKELTDRWYGWLAISASRSTRTNKLTGKESDYYLDTPLVLNWVMNYKLNDKWSFGGRFALQSGRAYTPIIGAQKNPFFDDHILPVYGEPYSERLPVYARLDLRMKRATTFWGHEGAWTLDVLNALNRHNVNDRHLDYKRTHSPSDYKLEDEVGLGIIPAAGISVTF